MVDPNISGLAINAAGGYFLLVIALPIFIVIALLVIIFTLLSVSDKLSTVVDHLDALNESTLQEPMTKDEYDKYKKDQAANEANEKTANNRLAVIVLCAVLGIVVLAFSLIMINVAQ